MQNTINILVGLLFIHGSCQAGACASTEVVPVRGAGPERRLNQNRFAGLNDHETGQQLISTPAERALSIRLSGVSSTESSLTLNSSRSRFSMRGSPSIGSRSDSKMHR